MKIDVITLFPDAFRAMLDVSIIGTAQNAGLVTITAHQLRDYTLNKQKQVDDYPYGGGAGMVLSAQPLFSCWSAIRSAHADAHIHTVLMSPAGKKYTQEDARRLLSYGHIILVCGHYEGVDERFSDACVDEELSIGDYVLTGGEIPAMAVADSICRLVPGVLADEVSFTDESHWSGLLEYPQYTRPEHWEGCSVPPILLSGDHKKIAQWRRYYSIARTILRRPDMWNANGASGE
ncbi:MAG: tRNA (guanosine(37)-N1)-methyltransferase TrmD [Oscillospiraceae bacterium]|jgi:tRNA (guanine37-N1)-methyltransferase|nr:tRNA (guanosine(37)-N1)-methyltransferase TrmD [Oscillospiraceae bacterium]